MMYKGGRFARRRMENERARGGSSKTVRHALCAIKEKKRIKERETEKENDAREAYHGVIALSSINHVTYDLCSSMYSV